MIIGCQGFHDAAFTHQDKADRIAKRVGFVRTFFKEIYRQTVQSLVNPNDFNHSIA